ncbi:hypothetical protein KJ966_19270 [bacterium]|nr:hypothetical protein [bacterium]
MAKVIDLNHYKKKRLGKVCFTPWNQRFRESYDESTTLKDLSDKTLLYLASPGEKSTNAFYEIIHCVKHPQLQKRKQSISKQDELEMMDVHLLMADRVRFELISRLSWIVEYPDENIPIIDLISMFQRNTYKHFHSPPKLALDHSHYSEFQKLIDREKVLFIKKLFVNALIVFNNRTNNSSEK